jgi:hypothetical protein
MRSRLGTLWIFLLITLAGCGGADAPVAPLAGNAGSFVSQAEKQPSVATHARARTWMSPDASKMPNLLYVANQGSGSVAVYNYTKGDDVTLVGSLSGFSRPGGMCTDKSGKVWITDYPTRRIIIYAHGGTSPIATIQQKKGFPNACAVDPATGNLAVTDDNPNGHYEAHATVHVYPPGQLKGPGIIYGRLFYKTGFAAYDNSGDLFVDGTPCLYYYGCYYGGGPPGLFELAKGASDFGQVSFDDVTLVKPTGLNWLNPTLLLTDSDAQPSGSPVAYKLSVSNFKATVVQTLPFSQSASAEGVGVRAHLAIVPEPTSGAVRIYKLSDGSLVSTITDGLDQPFSAVVSQKK